MEDLKKYLKGVEINIFSLIDHAISVAASDYPNEFMKKRDDISHQLMLHISSHEHENEDHDEFIETKESHETTNLTKQSDVVKEVFMIKGILSNQDEAESQVAKSLSRLDSMSLSYEILKESMIGRNVNLLQQHKSKEIRHMARKLVRRWREVADEHQEQMKMAAENENENEATIAAAVQLQVPHDHKMEQPLKVDREIQCCKQETSHENHVVLNHKRQRVIVCHQNLHQDSDFNIKSASLPHIKSKSPILDEKSYREKIEAAKKRLQQGYRQAEMVKRQHKVKLICVKDLPKQQPQHEQQQRKRMRKL